MKRMASSRGWWASPERTVVWTEPPPKTTTSTRRADALAQPTKVAVVYYLSRNGQLDHPHFMESLTTLSLTAVRADVLDRLNVLWGAGMADAYSWSSKRSYRNGYVWHDLTADDLVHPANGNEYVLKGSELLVLYQLPARPRDASASSSSSSSSSCHVTDNKRAPPAVSGRAARRKNWSSFDLGEYRVAAVSRGAEALAADAATQTDERRGGRRGRNTAPPVSEQAAMTELGIDKISPSPSSSSPETLETLIKHDARLAAATNNLAALQPEAEADTGKRGEDVGVISGGRMRVSAVLMQLISCGSIPAAPKRDGVPARYTAERRLPRGRSDLSSSTGTGTGTAADAFSGSLSGVGVGMEREYFSGSLVETKKMASWDRAGVGGGELGGLKRSSSYNADRTEGVVTKVRLDNRVIGLYYGTDVIPALLCLRHNSSVMQRHRVASGLLADSAHSSVIRGSHMNTSTDCKLKLAVDEEEEVDGVRARCIPAARKPSKTTAAPARRSHQPTTSEPAGLTD